MKTETYTGRTRILLDRLNFQLKTLLFLIVTNSGYAFPPAMNESLHAVLVKICTSRHDPLFHSSNDGVIDRKILSI